MGQSRPNCKDDTRKWFRLWKFGRDGDRFSPLAYLNWIQRGSTADWKRLYELCKEARVARAVAEVLVQRDPDLPASARLWKYLLEDLHPELDIDLRLERRNPGV